MALTKIEASNIAAGAVASSGFVEKKVYTAASTLWTKPTGVTKIIVEVQGAGGGSGSTGGSPDSAGVGGGGAYASKFLDVTNVATCTVTVGAAAAAASGATGGVGGTSEFVYVSGTASFTTISAVGGNGGQHNNYYGAAITATPTTGDVNIAGQSGYTVFVAGSSMFGFGGKAITTASGTGRLGTGYGSGPAGPSATSTNGNVAQPGIVIVWEFK